MNIPLTTLFPIHQRFRLAVSVATTLSVFSILSLTQSSIPNTVYAQPATQNGIIIGSSPTTTTRNNTQTSAGSTTPLNPSPVTVQSGTSTDTSTSPTPGTTANSKTTTSTPNVVQPSAPPASSNTSYKYPLHNGIKTTWFYAGEPASADNDFIQNVSSAWQTDWQGHYGGSDNPYSRCGYQACGFTPRENPFYFALPFSDYTNTGPVSNLSMVYWYTGPIQDGQSILKNRWIQITALGKTVYAQWEDVGPFNEHDGNYVFGSSAPASTRAGLDISPATRDYIGMGGSTISSWRFVDYNEVPDGPWKSTITTSTPDW